MWTSQGHCNNHDGSIMAFQM